MAYLSALVAGAGGFIGGHLVKSLINDGYDVLAVDIAPVNSWLQVHDEAENISADLTQWEKVKNLVFEGDEVYNLMASTGGVWYAHINNISCLNAALANINLLKASQEYGASKYFYASSASVYPVRMQWSTKPKPLDESKVYPAQPEDNHGLEKLFSEAACWQWYENYRLETRVGRYFNVYGPNCEWTDGKEGVVAALCRKVASNKLWGDSYINIWGDGKQSRSFIYIDDAIAATRLITDFNYRHPLNIGHPDTHTIDELLDVIEEIAGYKSIRSYDTEAPVGVRSRACDTSLSKEILSWQPSVALREGVEKTYAWVYDKYKTNSY
jgi:GDP-D-mannose 3',5'-epimerase